MNNVINYEFSRVQLLNNKIGKFVLPPNRNMASSLNMKIDEERKTALYEAFFCGFSFL